MKNSRLCMLATLAPLAVNLFGQSLFETFDRSQIRRISGREARESAKVEITIGSAPGAGFAGAAVTSLPTWSYQVTAAQNGRTYSGQIVGTNPFNTSATTNVNVALVPVILNITQNGRTYSFDPTVQDPGCLGAGNTAFNLMANSPLFANASFNFSGVNVGNTQYADAFVRGEFWQYVSSKPSYHVLLNATPAAPLIISINAGTRGNITAEVFSVGSQCGNNANGVNPPGLLAVVNINTIDAALQSYIRTKGLNASMLPFFVTYNAVMSQGAASNLNNCCILGYHNALSSGQTYGIAEFEGRDQTVFTAVSDVSSASHEINEWMNDPMGTNPTPSWGNVGQVTGGCQADFEVGDPLSNSLLAGPVYTGNGFPYHLQELAYYSWFYGGASLGAGGAYSNNGTFKGAAKLCPPGGTN